jgi:hypothetical protein
MKFKMTLRFSGQCLAIVLTTLFSSGQADAASIEQAKAQCHDQFVPVVAFMRTQKMGGNRR